MKRRWLWLFIVLALCLPLMGSAGCEGTTPETEKKVEEGAGAVGGAATTAAPFLPPPFNLIAIGVAAGAAGLEGWLARRRGQRAKGLAVGLQSERERAEAYAIQAEAEIKAKYKMHAAGIALTTFLDVAQKDEGCKEHIEAVLAKLKTYKAENPWVIKSLGVLDALRKGYTTLEAFTESMKAPGVGGVGELPPPSTA